MTIHPTGRRELLHQKTDILEFAGDKEKIRSVFLSDTKVLKKS